MFRMKGILFGFDLSVFISVGKEERRVDMACDGLTLVDS